MATLIIERTKSAKRAAHRSNQLGKFVYSISKYLFCAITAALPIVFFFVYKAYSGIDQRWNTETLGWSSSVDWNSIWATWGIVLAGWMVYAFGLAMIALVGAVAQAKAESLEIEIALAEVSV